MPTANKVVNICVLDGGMASLLLRYSIIEMKYTIVMMSTPTVLVGVLYSMSGLAVTLIMAQRTALYKYQLSHLCVIR